MSKADKDKKALFDDDSLDASLNASKVLSWAANVESHPENYPLDDCAKAAAVMRYYDKWRALVNAVKTVEKLSHE